MFNFKRIIRIVSKALLCSVLMLPATTLVADQSVEIRVSATIPPRFCEYPNQCDQVFVNGVTRLFVQGETIRYIGPRPLVIKSFDTMIILF